MLQAFASIDDKTFKKVYKIMENCFCFELREEGCRFEHLQN